MKRFHVINKLISDCGFKRYLEIGVNRGHCYREINCDFKLAVDPNYAYENSIVCTSDWFFKNYTGDKFDIIFIDGLHLAEQTILDIENASLWTQESGMVVCHDALPQEEIEQSRTPRQNQPWTGDVWKALHQIAVRGSHTLTTIDCDYGVCVLQKNKSNPFPYASQELTWDYFLKNKSFLNIIHPEAFMTLDLCAS